MTDDARRVLDDYEPMSDFYAEEAEREPLKASYDRPAIMAMAGDVQGKRVLDVGCAAGHLAALLIARGASVVGIDVSRSLLAHARERLGDRVELHEADIAQPMPFLETESFDVVTASLVLHYVGDWTNPLREFHRVLRPGGRFVFSTHHPIHDIEIANPPAPYFQTVLLNDTWRKGGREFVVRFYHRPLSAILDAVVDAGFLVERIPEPIPDRSAFASDPVMYERMTKRPWFLFVRAIKVRS